MTAQVPPPETEEAPGPTLAARFALWQRAGGIATPLATAIFAFLVAGLVVLATGHDPLQTYHAIFNGAGLNWLFPWVHGFERQTAAFNLQETGLLFIPLVLSGLAVAFAFRCGLFNIGGQGQYIVGSIFALWIGSSFATMNGPLHVVLAGSIEVGHQGYVIAWSRLPEEAREVAFDRLGRRSGGQRKNLESARLERRSSFRQLALFPELCEQPVRVVLTFLHVRLIERVDPKQRPDRRCRHFPSEEFLAQVDLLGEVDSDYRMPHCFESAQLTIGVCVRLRPESQVNKKPIIAVALGLTQRFARHWG